MMKKILFFILLLICFQAMSQNDTTKYFNSVDYGWNYKRLKARLAFIPPIDTVGNKLGFVLLNGNIYSGNGSYWTSPSISQRKEYLISSETFSVSVSELVGKILLTMTRGGIAIGNIITGTPTGDQIKFTSSTGLIETVNSFINGEQLVFIYR